MDQFEAVFTQCQDESERAEFVAEVCELAKASLVILALRADFYQHALRYPELAAALQSRHVVLGPMTAEQVRRAITEPARLARVDVEEGLVGLLLHDLTPPERAGGPAAYQAGALPLLSHALLATWEHSRGGTLTVADYLSSGGISDALTRTAEGVYGSLSPAEQRLARRLFLRLVQVSDDAPPTRATVRLSEPRAWGGESEHVLARFVAERLITVDADAAQITHDAQLAAWPRLRSWIEGGLEHLLTGRRVAGAARAWQDAGRENAALWRGSQLAAARGWASDEDDPASPGTLASEFIAASIAAEQEHQRAERRRTRRLRRLVASLAVLVVAVGTLAGFAFQQRQEATTARDDANSREIARRGRPGPRPGRAPGRSAQRGRLRHRRYPPGGREPAGVVRFAGRGPAAGLRRSGAVGQPQPGPPAARGGRRGRHAAALGRHLAGAPGAGRRPAGAGQRQPAVCHLVQPRRADPGRGRGRPHGRVVGREPARSPRPAREADGPGEHGVLGRVQPGRQDAGRGQRR